MSVRYVPAAAAREDRNEIVAYTYRRSGSLDVARRVDRKLKEEFERIRSLTWARGRGS